MKKSLKNKLLVSEDFSVSQESQNPKRSTDNLIFLVGLSYFAIMISLASIFSLLDINVYQLFRLFFLALGLSFLIPIKVYRKRWELSFYEYLFYNIIFVGPGILLLFFSLNFISPSSNYNEIYLITAKERQDQTMVLSLENNKYHNKPYLRTFSDIEDLNKIIIARQLEFEFSNGLFGIRIIKARRFLYP